MQFYGPSSPSSGTVLDIDEAPPSGRFPLRQSYVDASLGSPLRKTQRAVDRCAYLYQREVFIRMRTHAKNILGDRKLRVKFCRVDEGKFSSVQMQRSSGITTTSRERRSGSEERNTELRLESVTNPVMRRVGGRWR